MGSHGGDQTAKPGNDATGCSETTVEINIKTLDSRTFTLRVDKCVPVPELKQQIASITGVLTEQQRLICRGRVLKDDQLLSAYQVEDGHTLHLVERPPFAPVQGSSSDHPASGGEQNTGGRTGPEMLVGTFDLSDQGDAYFPDLNRLLSSILSSIGITRFGDVSEGLDLNQLPSERPATASGLNSARNSSNPGETLQPPIIPDSLTTLSQYLSHLRQEFLSIEGERMNSRNMGFSGRGGQNSEAAGPSLDTRGALAPESLAEVMSSSRQMLIEQASECLSQLARQLEHHSDINDTSERSRIQANAIRSGVLFQNLGALFLELGRTMTTLRMGQTPADALVNAGPSVFVSSTGPNPIMVQQLPFQHGSSSGSGPGPFGSVQLVPGLPGSSVGTSLRPSNIDIRIRTGSVLSRREPTVSQPQTQLPPDSATIVNPVQQNARRADSSSQSQGQRVRAYPRGSIGILYPVLARVENTSGNPFRHQSSQTSNRSQNPNSTGERHSVPSSATQRHSAASDGGNGLPADERHDQGFSFTFGGGFEHLFNEMEHFLNHEANSSGLGSNQRHGEAAQDNGGSGGSQATSEAVTDEGILFSNALRQLLPILHQNDPNLSSAEGNPIETQVDNTADEGASSSRSRRGSDSQSSPKRQRRE